MALGKSFAKVTKSLSSKKSGSPLHPKGRKAKLLARAALRDEKVNQKKLLHTVKKQGDIQVYLLIHDLIEKDSEFSKLEQFTLDQIKALTLMFINRDDEELEKLIKQRRPGRPASKRQDLIQIRKSQEMNFYETGWKLPDLTDPENVKHFKHWKGDHGGLTAIKFRIIKKDDAEDGDSKME